MEIVLYILLVAVGTVVFAAVALAVVMNRGIRRWRFDFPDIYKMEKEDKDET